MYLSRVQLAGQYARNPYEHHNGLWQLFSDSPDRERDFLYRVEQQQRDVVSLLVQSLRPVPSNVFDSIAVLETKQWKPSFHSGQVLRFFLYANPVKTIKDQQQRKNSQGEIKSCRVPLVDFDEQCQWLIKRLSGAAQILDLDASVLAPLYFRKQKTGAGKIQPIRYQGVLSVKEPDDMYALLKTGIGPAKAFGCGLMSLAAK